MGSEWTYTPLNQVAKLTGGFAFKSKDFIGDGIPVAKIKNVRHRDIDLSDVDYVSEETAKACSKFLIKHGDILISMTGSGMNAPASIVGRVARHTGQNNAFLINQRVGRFSALPGNELDLRYLYYYFSQKDTQLELVSIATGSANQVNLSATQIESLEIPLPPLPEQKAIAHILGSLDDKIELNRRMNATLEGMAQALFKSWFVDFDPVLDNAIRAGNAIPEEFAARAEVRRSILDQNQKDECSVLNDELRSSKIQDLPQASHSSFKTHHSAFPSKFTLTDTMGWIPEGWKMGKLSDLLEVKYGKDHKKLNEGSIPVYGSGGLMRHADKSLYTGESVLIPRKGTLSNILYLNEEFWTVDTMFYTIPKSRYAPKYSFYHLKDLDFVSMNVGSAVPSMTTKVLNELPIVLPDEISLKYFDKILASYFDKSEANNKQSQSLTKLRDTLLPKLISGELRVPQAERMIKDEFSTDQAKMNRAEHSHSAIITQHSELAEGALRATLL
ncbi:MAG: restriction endonuclease subunit S, partial [Verrucomicrobiales bacterium]|nr:restriction endonuclease subunit S [Verrucomicrobiales bacterium]